MSMGQCLVEGMQKRQLLSSGKLYKVTLLLCEILVYTYIHIFTFGENFYLSITNSKLLFLEVFWEKGNWGLEDKREGKLKDGREKKPVWNTNTPWELLKLMKLWIQGDMEQ